MKINDKGKDCRVTKWENSASCPFCNCNFSFKEEDIEIMNEGSPYEKGLKRFLRLNKGYIVHRYVICPWCKAKLKLKIVVDTID
jgi:hypothetical protein